MIERVFSPIENRFVFLCLYIYFFKTRRKIVYSSMFEKRVGESLKFRALRQNDKPFVLRAAFMRLFYALYN